MDGYQMNAKEFAGAEEMENRSVKVALSPCPQWRVHREKEQFTPWVDAGGAYGCPRACQGIDP